LDGLSGTALGNLYKANKGEFGKHPALVSAILDRIVRI
jgi:hypothetical protein